MKKSIIFALVLVFMGMTASAQKTMVVNTEKVFSAVAAYNDALETLDKLGQQYQKTVDDAYEQIETMFNDYQQQKAYLSNESRASREKAILDREQEVMDYQERMFGQEGELMKKRVELVKPVQDRVFGMINSYAQSNGYDLVLDIAGNPTVLYYNPSADKTEEIIKLVK